MTQGPGPQEPFLGALWHCFPWMHLPHGYFSCQGPGGRHTDNDTMVPVPVIFSVPTPRSE